MAKSFHRFFADCSSRHYFYEGVIQAAQKGRSMQESFGVLMGWLWKNCSNWPSSKQICPILISIDEVHVLCTPRNEDINLGYTLYLCFKSVLNKVVSLNFVVLSLSTASHIPSLAPLKEIAPSMREREAEPLLPSPFTELPFDVYAIANPLTPGEASLDSVGSLEFAAKFGRPL
jgi:hypothetical protein